MTQIKSRNGWIQVRRKSLVGCSNINLTWIHIIKQLHSVVTYSSFLLFFFFFKSKQFLFVDRKSFDSLGTVTTRRFQRHFTVSSKCISWIFVLMLNNQLSLRFRLIQRSSRSFRIIPVIWHWIKNSLSFLRYCVIQVGWWVSSRGRNTLLGFNFFNFTTWGSSFKSFEQMKVGIFMKLFKVIILRTKVDL